MRLTPARRLALAGAATALIVAGLSGCGAAGGASTGDANDIVFAVGSPTLTETTAPYAAVPDELGYWKDEGLNVDVQPTDGATASMQLLLSGKADIVNGGSAAFYQAAASSKDVKVIALQADNIWRIVVPEDSDIDSIADLRGKTIGAQSLSSASYLFGKVALEADGLDADKDVEWLPVGVGAQAAQAFDAGDIDAYATYDGPSGVVANVMGAKLRNLSSPLDKVPGLLGYATTADFLDDHPDVVAKFLRGTYEGAVFCKANPAAALQIQWQAHPDQKPAGESTDEAVDEFLPVVKSRFDGGATPGPNGLIGDLPDGQVQSSIDFHADQGLIEKSLDAAEVTDLSLNKDANDFDAAQIAQQAKEWTP